MDLNSQTDLQNIAKQVLLELGAIKRFACPHDYFMDCTDGYMERRALELFSEQYPDADIEAFKQAMRKVLYSTVSKCPICRENSTS